MKIMGIDPGTRCCGYGVIEVTGNQARALGYGALRDGGPAVPDRLRTIYEGLRQVIEDYHPDVVAVEGAFYHKNVRTAIKIGEGRGVALLAATADGAEIQEYAPAEVKKAVTGNGRAHKQQVQKMVQMILGLPEVPTPDDAADALAIALCHFHRVPL